jgi:hypothetical protein
MASYKYDKYLKQLDALAFDEEHSPGDDAPLSGIYRCARCDREVAANRDDPLPPQNHHQHPAVLGPIRWRLIVMTN